MTKEAMEKLKPGAVLVGDDALAVARDVLHTVSRDRRNKEAWRELARCIKKAEARASATPKTG
jgi:hypothetical protein